MKIGNNKLPGRRKSAGEIPASARETRNKQAAARTRRLSQERFLLAFHSNLAGISISRLRDGLIIDVNDEWLKMFGFIRSEVVGKIVADRAWRNAEERDRIVQELQQQGSFRDRELQFRRTNGEEFTALASASVSVLGGESIFILSMIDITNRKRAEKELLGSEQRYRALAETSPDAIIVHRHGLFLYANPAALSLYGAADFVQLRERNLLELVSPEDRSLVAERLRRLESGEKIPPRESRVLRLDGQEVPVEAYASTVMYGDSPAIQVIIRDITERRRAEIALQQLNAALERKVQERTAELTRRAGQLRALAGELTISEQRERKRLASLLHDHLQQLLVAAKLRTALLGRGLDNLSRAATKEVEDLIDESIAASRSLTAELSPPILHQGGLNAGLQWLARRMADRQGLLVNLEMEETGVLADDLKILLFESVRELLFNVVKHARSRSAAVNLRPVGESLQIIVSDEGVGFDPNMLAKAGESGAGFGLFGVRERLELFGGQMQIDSTPGQGSRVVLCVPITQPAAVELIPKEFPAPGRAAEATQVASPVAGRKIRIMLADDHKIVRQGIANLISNEPDLEIIGEAGDGLEAVECATRLLPDVLLMDLSMPRLDGIEAARILHESRPEIRIIGLSMHEEAERAQAMRAAGAVDYITKSGPAEELINAIRKCIRLSHRSAHT